MRWAAPWAWLLALTAILPVVAHLWSRRRPVSLAFPTLRFLRAASPVSRRLRRIQDWPLLLLRIAVVTAICAAAAGPTLVSSWRRDAWRSRLHRIILVDSDVAAEAVRATADLRQGATSWSMLGEGPVAGGLDEAIAQASARADRMRTEIDLVWDGSRSTLSPGDLADVPPHIGLRLVTIRPSSRSRDSSPPDTTEAPIAIRAEASDGETRARLLTALSEVAAPGLNTPIEVVWPGSSTSAMPSSAKAPAELLRVLDEIADDARVRDAAERSTRDRRAPPPSVSRGPTALGEGTGVGPPSDPVGGRWLARTLDGAPLLRGWADGTRLVLALDASPTSPLAWWSSVVALESASRPWRAGVAVDRWSPSEVARAQREPGMPETVALPGGLDTRAAWIVALALLLLEQRWRRKSTPVDVEVVDAA